MRAPSPLRLVRNKEGPMTDNVHSPSANVEVAPADEGAGVSQPLLAPLTILAKVTSR